MGAGGTVGSGAAVGWRWSSCRLAPAGAWVGAAVGSGWAVPSVGGRLRCRLGVVSAVGSGQGPRWARVPGSARQQSPAGFGGFLEPVPPWVGHFGLDHNLPPQAGQGQPGRPRRAVRPRRQIVRREHCAGCACRHTAGQKHSQQTFSLYDAPPPQSPMGVVPHRDRFEYTAPCPRRARCMDAKVIFSSKEKAPPKLAGARVIMQFYAWSYLLGTGARRSCGQRCCMRSGRR